jgi:hypothetical protein
LPSSLEFSQEAAAPGDLEIPVEPKRNGMPWFLLLLALIVVLNLAAGLAVVPLPYVPLTSLCVTILAVALPIFALFSGANARWAWTRGVAYIVIGVAIQFGGRLIGERMHQPLLAGLSLSVAQTGLVVWCLGLGGFLASILRDKNLLLPLAIFLALFDMWLVFVPEGPVGQIARSVGPQQQILARVAYVVPRVAQVSHGGRPEAYAYIGPADFVFMAMFFVALFRFHMRPRQTFFAMVPTLVAYLLVVLFFGRVHFGPITLQAMPALLPIGAVVLAVNWREFKLTKDEMQSTIAVAVIGIAVVTWRMWLHWNDSERPTAPLPQPAAQASPGPPGLSAPAPQGLLKSPSPPAGANKPGPR